VALIDACRIGKATSVFAEITLQSQAGDVLECHLMAGMANYLIKIMAMDTQDFARTPASI
jgi:Lrp/AsnC family transcriptional regulator, leucine-responsive regulatory protein